jgi:hypothetical protein
MTRSTFSVSSRRSWSAATLFGSVVEAEQLYRVPSEIALSNSFRRRCITLDVVAKAVTFRISDAAGRSPPEWM